MIMVILLLIEEVSNHNNAILIFPYDASKYHTV